MKSRSETTMKTDAIDICTSNAQIAKKYCYAITISKHQKKDYVDKSELNDVLTILKQRNTTLNIHSYVYENSGKYKQLHFHGTGQATVPIYYKKNCSINGFRIEWKLMKSATDRARWSKYISKEAYNRYAQEHILEENYYHYNNFWDNMEFNHNLLPVEASSSQ